MAKNRLCHHCRLSPGVRSILIGLFGSLLVLSTHLSWFVKGIPYTHDGQIHLTRMAHFYLTVKQGQFPPRWAGVLNNSFGYPVFNFNYPLANILAYPLIALDWPVIGILKLFGILAIISAFWGMYRLLLYRLNLTAAWIGALFYALSPYLSQLLYVRGSMGELFAYALIPWVIHYIHLVIFEKSQPQRHQLGMIITLGLFILSHNILVLIIGIVLTIYLSWIAVTKGLYSLNRLLMPFVVAFLLGSFFWLPAILEKSFTILDQSTLTQGFRYHFATLTELYSAPWSYGFSQPGPVDGLSFNLGLSQWLLLLTCLILAIKLRYRPARPLFLGLIILICLTLPISAKIWTAMPFMTYIQFPWRWLITVQLVIAIIAGVSYARLTQNRWFWGSLTILLLYQAIHHHQSVDRISPTNEDLFYATESTSTLDENMPVWFDKFTAYGLKQDRFKDQVVITDHPDTRVDVRIWTGTTHQYTVTNTTQDRLIERSAYFPGWQLTVDNQLHTINYQEEAYPGLITYSLPPGTHIIKTTFTQNTWPRHLGNTLTVIGIIITALLVIRLRITNLSLWKPKN